MEDGITLEDGTAYLIAVARQVAVKTTSGTQWHWTYQATKEKSGDELGDWDI